MEKDEPKAELNLSSPSFPEIQRLQDASQYPPTVIPHSNSNTKSVRTGCILKQCVSRKDLPKDSYDHSSARESTNGEYVVAISRASYQVPAQGQTSENDVQRIPREEAICRKCYEALEEQENGIKLNCGCPATLIHENCAIDWFKEEKNNKCDGCGKEIRKILVVILSEKDFATVTPPTKKVKKWCCF